MINLESRNFQMEDKVEPVMALCSLLRRNSVEGS